MDLKYTVQVCPRADGSTSFRIHARTHGAGYGVELSTDTPTGTNYILNGQDRIREVSGPAGSGACYPISSVETYRNKLISKGGSPNAALVINTTFSVDSNCNVAFNNTFQLDCRG